MMYAYDVMVIAKGKQPEQLTYFGNEMLACMSRVIVPLRKKEVRGFVLECRPLSHLKSEIKSSDFSLRKIIQVLGEPMVNNFYLQTLNELSAFYIVRKSFLYRTLIPISVFSLSTQSSKRTANYTEETGSEVFENVLLCGSLSERIVHYKAMIRESFARGHNVYIVVPTFSEANLFYSHLAQGIETYIHILHSKVPKVQLEKTLTSIYTATHPFVIIGTAPFLSCPDIIIGQLILEHESSSAYTVIESNIDLRILITRYAELAKIPLVVADTFPSIATYHRMLEKNLTHSTVFHVRIPFEKSVSIVDMKNTETGGNHILSERLHNTIQTTMDKKGSIFLFSLKHGLGSHIVCQDCGNAVVCNKCSHQLGLKLINNTKTFYCKNCNEIQASQMRCTHCEGWRLKEIGIGLDTLYIETKKEFPDFPVVCIGTNTEKQDKKTLDEILPSQGVIVIGTPKALSLLPAPTDIVCVVSFDSLIYIPHYAINERVLSLFSSLLDCTKKECIIQTRNPHLGLLTHIQNNTLDMWYIEELALREKHNYPPYCSILELRYHKFSLEDQQAAFGRVSEFISSYQVLSRNNIPKNEYSLLIKLPVNFFTIHNAQTHPLSISLESERSYGAHIYWNSPTL
ncbi:MAG: hypothetical protein KBB88_02065 [Candidatus Pacebacteria bacterium]|nr:hypothetical protein [Candidatus Paceibacterota bacterium]